MNLLVQYKEPKRVFKYTLLLLFEYKYSLKYYMLKLFITFKIFAYYYLIGFQYNKKKKNSRA